MSLEQENEKLKKDNSYLVSRSEGDIQKLHGYLSDCENELAHIKDVKNDLER